MKSVLVFFREVVERREGKGGEGEEVGVKITEEKGGGSGSWWVARSRRDNFHE